MPPLPPPPPPEGMHVVVVHFPIALLMVAPLFILLAGVTGKKVMMLASLLLLCLGIAGAWAASSSGEMAMDAMEDFTVEGDAYDLAYEVLEQHEFNGHFARNLFSAIGVLYGIFVALILSVKKLQGVLPRSIMHALVLAACAYSALILANAGHEGGRLVHEFGAKAVLAETADAEEEDGEEVEEAEQPAEDETVDQDT